jgi:hypothetical protein
LSTLFLGATEKNGNRANTTSSATSSTTIINSETTNPPSPSSPSSPSSPPVSLSFHEQIIQDVCTNDQLTLFINHLSTQTREAEYRNAIGSSFIVIYLTQLYVSGINLLKRGGDGAFAIGIAEIQLFELMIDVTRCLRNCAVMNQQHQYRIHRHDGLKAGLELLQHVSKGNIGVKSWIGSDGRESNGALYLEKRDSLLRTTLQFIANAMASNNINQAIAFDALYPDAITELIKEGHQNDRKLLPTSTMILWYCVAQWEECMNGSGKGDGDSDGDSGTTSGSNDSGNNIGALQRLQTMLNGVKEPDQDMDVTTIRRKENIRRCLSTLLVATTSTSGSDKALENDAALDGVALLVRGMLRANRLSDMISMLNSVINEKNAIQVCNEQPLVEIAEIVLYHFLQRYVDEDTKQQHATDPFQWSSGMAGAVANRIQVLIGGGAERARKYALQQKQDQEQELEEQEEKESPTLANASAMSNMSSEALVAWTILESEALEVLLCVSSTMLVKGNKKVQDELCGGGTLLRVVLSELARLQKTPVSKKPKKPANQKRKKIKLLPVRKGIKTVLMQLVANLCSMSEHMKDRVRELGGIPIVLNCCTSDVKHPMLREWALVAVNNMLKDNEENQKVVASLQPQGKVMRTGNVGPGMEAEVGVDGKVTLRKSY